MTFEIAVFTSLVALVTVGFLYLPRLEPEPALRYWAWGWAALLVQITLDMVVIGNVGRVPPITLVSYTAGLCGPGFFLAGAMAYVGRTRPPWLIPAILATGTLRGLLAELGLTSEMILFSLFTEVPLLAAGSVVILRGVPGRPQAAIGRVLAASYAGMAVMEGAAASVWFTETTTIWLFVGAAGTTLLAAFVQVVAVLARVRTREHAGLELLRDVARAGVSEDDPVAIVRVVLRRMRETLGLDGGGGWLLDAEARCLRCVEMFGTAEEIAADYASIPQDRADAKAVLGRREPLISEAISKHPDFNPQGARGPGFSGGAVLPLHWQDEPLGFLFVGLRPPRRFREEEERLLGAIGDELAQALHHVEANRALAEHAAHAEAQERTLRAVLDTAPVGVLLEDREGRIAMVSQRALAHGAEESWLGRPIGEVAEMMGPRLAGGAPTVERLGRVHEGASEGQDLEVRLGEPEERTLRLFTSPVRSPEGDHLGRVWVSWDITEERRLEDQLRQAQKLETVGRLAGGIAHDFNNQLTAILGNARLALDEEGSPELHESLLDLERAAEHCAKLTQSLLAFSRRSPVSPRSLEVPEVMDEVRELLRPLIPSSIALEVAAEEDTGPVLADAIQLQQVLVNLVVNARDSISSEGEIRVSARTREVDPLESAPHGASPGTYIAFEVRDTGSGMDRGTVERIFEPFYTTKGVGEGTGLGLAIVYGVVQAHAGWIEVDSEPGCGTSFRILLPSAPRGRAELGARRREVLLDGTETVLVAEDEPALLRLACRVLRRRGYQVLEARDGNEAVEVFRDNARRIDLVMLDVTMPGRTGFSALTAIRSISPRVAAILTSGNPDLVLFESAPLEAAFLEKPYDATMLVSCVRDVLDSLSERESGSPD